MHYANPVQTGTFFPLSNKNESQSSWNIVLRIQLKHQRLAFLNI